MTDHEQLIALREVTPKEVWPDDISFYLEWDSWILHGHHNVILPSEYALAIVKDCVEGWLREIGWFPYLLDWDRYTKQRSIKDAMDEAPYAQYTLTEAVAYEVERQGKGEG